MKLNARVAKYIHSKQRVWGHDRKKTLGASEAFGCLRRAYFERKYTGARPVQSLGAAERGNVMENHFVVPFLFAEYGAKNVHFAGDDQTTLFIGDVSCTPDALVTGVARDYFADDGLPDLGTDCFVAEIKSGDPNKDMETLDPQHGAQAGLQLEFIRRHSIAQPQFAVVMYFDASVYDKVYPHFVPYDPNLISAAQERAERMFKASDPAQLPPEGSFTGSCDYCPFKQICSGADVRSRSNQINALGDNAQKALDVLVAKWRQLKSPTDQSVRELKEISAEIEQLLRENKTYAAQSVGHKILVSSVKGRSSVSKAAVDQYIERHKLDRADFYTDGAPHTRVIIKATK